MLSDATQPSFASLSQAHSEDYLAALHALSAEVDKAMDALVSNALRSFEESLIRQRSLCERLAGLSKGSASGAGVDASDGQVIDAGFAERVAEASAKLRRLNDQYSALLKHSGDTLRIFAGLFRTYSAPSRPTTIERISINNWSCEL